MKTPPRRTRKQKQLLKEATDTFLANSLQQIAAEESFIAFSLQFRRVAAAGGDSDCITWKIGSGSVCETVPMVIGG